MLNFDEIWATTKWLGMLDLMCRAGDKERQMIALFLFHSANQTLITAIEHLEADSIKENFTAHIVYWESISAELKKIQEQRIP